MAEITEKPPAPRRVMQMPWLPMPIGDLMRRTAQRAALPVTDLGFCALCHTLQPLIVIAHSEPDHVLVRGTTECRETFAITILHEPTNPDLVYPGEAVCRGSWQRPGKLTIGGEWISWTVGS